MAIGSYLQDLFASNETDKQSLKALEALRKSVDACENSLAAPGQFKRKCTQGDYQRTSRFKSAHR